VRVLHLIVDIALAASGREGGLLGNALDRGLRALLGDVGVWIVVSVGVLAVTVAITGVSLKRVIGWCAARLAALRPATAPRSLREAFHLPALPGPGGRPATAVAAPSAVEREPVRFYDRGVEEDEDLGDDEDLDEDELDDAQDTELDDDELDDEEYDDDEDEEELADEPDDDAPGEVEWEVQDRRLTALPVISGEYEDVPLRRPPYVLPDVEAIFDPPQLQKIDDASRAHVLEDTLASFGVGAKVTHIERGPSITRYELRPERGVKISRISRCRRPRAGARGDLGAHRGADPRQVGGRDRGAQRHRVDRGDPRDPRSDAARGTCRRSTWRWARTSPAARLRRSRQDAASARGGRDRARQIGLPELHHRLAAGQRDAGSGPAADDRSQARRADRLQRHPAPDQRGHHRRQAWRRARSSR
jgi:hypothetical protein